MHTEPRTLMHQVNLPRTLATVTLAVVFALAAAAPPVSAGPPPESDQELAVVPLDDRPANLYFPAMTAAVADVDTAFPPDSAIGSFTEPGDGEAIGDWLLAQDNADGFVVSTSMLAYGGLIASRTGELPESVARDHVEALKTLRQQRPDAPIYVYDTIQRLAVTQLGGEAADYYAQVQEWAILVDRVENLGHEELRGELEALEAELPQDVIDDYLAARERNHQINRLMVEWVNEGVIDHLVLAQDDAAEYGLHRAEREELVELIGDLGVEDQAQVFPGADEVDATLIARFVQDQLGTEPTVSIEYSGQHGSEWIAVFEDTTFDVNIDRHLRASAAEPVEHEDADIVLMVNTPSPDGADRSADLDAFVARTAELIDDGREVIVVDAAEVNRADAELIERFKEEVPVTELLAYSGWNTAGNALGIATGHGLSRWAFLERSDRGAGVPSTLEAAQQHTNYLLHRFVLDDDWKNQVQPAAYDKGNAMGANVFGLEPDEREILDGYVSDELAPLVEEFHAEHFAGRQVPIAQRGATTHHAVIGDLESVDITLPWPRLFETTLEPDVQLDWPRGSGS